MTDNEYILNNRFGQASAISDTAVADIKEQIRKNALTRRKAISAEDRCARSRQACDRLAISYKDILVPGAMVAGYAALGSEVDVYPFLEIALQSQCHICLPCMEHQNLECKNSNTVELEEQTNNLNMEFFEVDEQAIEHRDIPFIEKPAQPIAFDDPLLASLRRVMPDEIDLIVVPLVAFDAQNYRLGYGGGNYDRFLVQLNPKTPKVGIAFCEQQVASLPIEAHDVQLSYIEIA